MQGHLKLFQVGSKWFFFFLDEMDQYDLFIYLFYNSIIESGEIWILIVSIKNARIF